MRDLRRQMHDDIRAINGRSQARAIRHIGFKDLDAEPRRLARLRVARHHQPAYLITARLHRIGEVRAHAPADAGDQCFHAVPSSSVFRGSLLRQSPQL